MAKRKPKPLDIFIVADQFRLVGKTLTIITRHPAFPVMHNQNPVTASMVCAAFSLELYFKTLIRMGRKTYGNEHDLSKLFYKIGRRPRRKIRKYWNENSSVVPAYVESVYGKDGNPIPNVTFDWVLSASKDAFVSMRYIYEVGIAPDTGWLADTIVEAARHTIIERNPTWEWARQIFPVSEVSFQPTSPAR